MRRKTSLLILVVTCFVMSTMTFANTTSSQVSKASPIQFSQNEYIRITQPIKDKIAVFDKEMNIMGEARYNTVIQLQLFNKGENQRIYPLNPYKIYNLDKVGMSQTFSKLIQLREGDNRLRFVYKYRTANGDLVEGRLVIYITRKTEQDKIRLKNLRIDNTEQFVNGVRRVR